MSVLAKSFLFIERLGFGPHIDCKLVAYSLMYDECFKSW